MTATEKLRCLLDERGVEYEAPNDIITMWAGNVCSWIAIEDKDGLAVAVNRDYLNPEQAVEATLGRGTCHMETDDSCQNWNNCSECGADYYTDQPINYCPNCGRRLVAE